MKIKMQTFHGKIVLVTGGSSGIGLALARLLTQAGARVWLMARRQDELKSALAQLNTPSAHNILPGDVSDWGQVNKAVNRITRESGVPDLVINSAGVTHPGYVQDLSLEIFHQMMDINYMGTVHVVKAVLPGMLERGSGYIVNISSSAGFLGVYGYTAYGASKYAVRGFTEALRAELKPLGIGVSLVYPPDTDTPQLAYENKFKPKETKALTSQAGLASAQQVAESILGGIRRGKNIILPGLENKLAYLLKDLLNPYMDSVIAKSRRADH